MNLFGKTVIIMMIITIISKILGFARELVLAYYYGTTNISDAYLISLSIPGVVFSFVSVALVTGFIPIYVNIIKNNNKEKENIFISNIINLLLIVSTFIVIFVFIFDKEIVSIFAPGFTEETLQVAITFTKIFIIGIYISGLLSIFTSFLNVHKNFIVPALGGIPFNIIAMFSIYISKVYYLNFIIIGAVIAKLIQLLMLLPFVFKKKFKYIKAINIHDENVKKILLMGIPLIIGVSLNQLNIIVDRMIASDISIGGISAISYAHHLNQFVQGVFVTSIITVLYPSISKMIIDNNINAVKTSISNAINIIHLFVLPATIFTMIFSVQIVQFLFARGEFDKQAVLMTSDVLFFYAIGMIAIALRELLSMVFYSMQDTKTPMINASIGIIINIILNIILSHYLGLKGLALATSLSAIFTAILMFISLKNKIGSFGIKQIVFTSLKIFIASLVTLFFILLTYYYFEDILSDVLLFIITMILGIIIYITLIYFMKIKETQIIFKKLKIFLPYKNKFMD